MAGRNEAIDASRLAPVLTAWALGDAAVAPIAQGLIHQSFSVRDGAVEYVLQRVSPIFSPRIHDNIQAVTEHLGRKGLCTLRLVPTVAGAPWLELAAQERWRLVTRIPGTTFDVCESDSQARAAGALVGRFHGALADFEAPLHAPGIPLHDTAAHLASLERALVRHTTHPLYDQVAPLGEGILRAAAAWAPLDGLPRRVVHGDLKFNNVLFAGADRTARCRAVSLIDLDLVSRQPLWQELGDAWRSWCNRSGEDAEQAALDLERYAAAARGWQGALGFAPEPAERESLAHGLERISLELAARFAADALNESYFGWDAQRFASRGHHNLVRARGQLSLHDQACATRAERARLFAQDTRRPGS